MGERSISGLALDACDAYCEHGGICILKHGHKGNHNSGFCEWADEDSLSKEEADKELKRKMEAQNLPGFEVIQAFT